MRGKRISRASMLAIALLLLADFSALSASGSSNGRRAWRRFKLVEHTCESGCSDTFKSPTGEEVSFVLACYTGSPADTRAEMDRLFAGGTIITKNVGTGKQRLSERTVVIEPGEHGKTTTFIYWYRRGESCFSFIQADSLKLVREFERSRAAAVRLSSYR